jgi:hypothetical protein
MVASFTRPVYTLDTYKRSSQLSFPLLTLLSAHTMAKGKAAKKSTVPRRQFQPRPIIVIPASHPLSAETTNENHPTNLIPSEDPGQPLPASAQEQRVPLQPSATTNPNPQMTASPTEVPPGSTQASNPARTKKATTSTSATTALAQDSTVAAKLAIALGNCIPFSEVCS